MATCSKRKVSLPKETETLVKEVVQGIPAASSTPAKKQCEQHFNDDALQRFDFNLNDDEFMVKEAARVKGYNLENPDIPPPIDAPATRSEEQAEAVIDIESFLTS
uniref:Uncharacterized protein n=1 Tax=Cannabis sativa TaxID=3483 RepID=A0A803PJQ2_CANSA